MGIGMVEIETNAKCICRSCKKRFNVYPEASIDYKSMFDDAKKEFFPDEFIIPCNYCGELNKIRINSIADDRLIQGRTPSANDLEWLKNGDEILKKASDIVDDQAKALVTISSTILSFYMVAITFLNITDKISKNYGFLFIFLFSICSWLSCIYMNLAVASPKLYDVSYSSKEGIKKHFGKKARIRYDKLEWGKRLFILALISSIISLIIPFTNSSMLMNFESKKSLQEVQFIIDPTQSQVFKDMSIHIENGSNKTEIVKLISQDGETYKVELANNKSAEFDKQLARSVIYMNNNS
jgi:hypothetical protein